MIQRVQSLYLLVASILLSVFMFFPFAMDKKVEPTIEMQILSDSGLATHKWLVYLSFALLVITIIVAIISIFLYKNRILQNKVVMFAFLSCCLFIGSLYYQINIVEKLINKDISYTIIIALPLIALILFMVTSRAIRNDEKKIRSIDRLR